MSAGLASRWGAVFMSSLILCGPTGCAMTDANRTRAEGAAAGAAVGAGVGYIAGKNRDSTLVGSAVGGIVGFLVGDGVAKEKATYAQQEQYLTQLADQAEKRTVETAKFNNRLQQEIASLQAMNKRLDTQRLALSERNRVVANRNARTNALLHQTNQQLAVVNQDLASLRKGIAAAQAAAQQDGNPGQEKHSAAFQLVANQTTALEEQNRVLARAAAQLQLIDTRRD